METIRLQGRPRGKRIALVLLCVTVAAAVVAVYLARGWFVDSWLMWRLNSSDRKTRNAAAEKLSDRKCLRAVPEMMRLIAADPEEKIGLGVAAPGDAAAVKWVASQRPRGKRSALVRYATPLTLALWKMGEEAIPAVQTAVSDQGSEDNARMRGTIECVLDRDTPIRPYPF